MNDLMKQLCEFGDVLENEAMSKHTTYRVGGNAKYFVYPKNEIALMNVFKLAKKYEIPTKIVGKGSNLLVSDDDFDGIVICLDRYFNEVLFDGNHVSVYAGQSIIYVAYEAMKRGLSGLEFASGIPGTVGGACYMNAGAYKCEIKDVLESIWVLKNDECVWLKNDECEFGYRTSIFKKHPDWVILAAKFKLSEKDPLEIKNMMDDRRQRRLATQPLDKPNAGSVFKNPESEFAWKLIDGCQLRGKMIHGAKVSEKHSNFIINEDHASAQDILDLIELIQKEVYEKYHILLKTEVECFNWKKH
ncbi:MAG: UDP-N-acetylmuramate dehydrogenase [Traorella sp.]